MIPDHPLPPVDLGRGVVVARIAKGNWQLAQRHGAPVGEDAAIDAMRAFVEAGLNQFDCADHYVGVEDLIGAFRRRYPALAGQLRISTKVVPDLERLPYLTRDDVRNIVHRSLQRLGTPRLDVAQMHWWDYRVPGYVECMQWLAELQRAGDIALLGTTNMDTPRLREIVDAGVPLATHQLQYSLLDRRPEHGLAAYCQANRIALLCYGVLAGGFISERWLGRPEPVPPLPNRSLVKYRLIIEDFGGWESFQRLLLLLQDIAGRHATTLAAVATHWVLQRPGVAVAIIGARTAERLPETLAALRLALTPADTAAIDALLAGCPGPPGDCYGLEREDDGPHSRIMWKNQNQHGAPADAAAYVPPVYRPAR
ncbi:MAG: aldo/keto reductase [Aquabacterium sp.]